MDDNPNSAMKLLQLTKKLPVRLGDAVESVKHFLLLKTIDEKHSVIKARNTICRLLK